VAVSSLPQGKGQRATDTQAAAEFCCLMLLFNAFSPKTMALLMLQAQTAASALKVVCSIVQQFGSVL